MAHRSFTYVAQDQGHFAANGLNVAIEDYPSSLAATNGVLANEVDSATAAEFVEAVMPRSVSIIR